MKIHMLQWALGAPDRVNLQEFHQGETPYLPEFLAEIFLQAGYAEDFATFEARRKKSEAEWKLIEERIEREERAAKVREELKSRRTHGRDYNERHDHFDMMDTIRVGYLPGTPEEKMGLWEGANPEFVAAARRPEIPPRQPVPAEKQNRFRF